MGKFNKVALTGGLAIAAILGALWAFLPATNAQLGAPQTWLGSAGGTANALTLTIHNIGQARDMLGVPFRFLPISPNTGATTITVTLDGGGTVGPINVKKPSSAGLASFIGSEFITSQIAEIVYDGTQFECSACTQSVAPGTSADFHGPIANIPAGWLKADGSQVSRTTFAALFNTLNQTVSASTTNTTTSVVVANSALFQVGWYVGGPNIPCSNVQISAIPDGTHLTINVAANASGSTTLTIGASPQGDCSTTFNLPNLTGRVTAGVDGTTNITSAVCSNAGSLGNTCGSQTQTLTLAQLPTGITTSGSNPISVAGTTNVSGTVSAPGGGNIPTTSSSSTIGSLAVAGAATTNIAPVINSALSWNNPSSLSGSMSGANTMTGTNTINAQSNNTSGTSHPILMPLYMTYKIVKT